MLSARNREVATLAETWGMKDLDNCAPPDEQWREISTRLFGSSRRDCVTETNLPRRFLARVLPWPCWGDWLFPFPLEFDLPSPEKQDWQAVLAKNWRIPVYMTPQGRVRLSQLPGKKQDMKYVRTEAHTWFAASRFFFSFVNLAMDSSCAARSSCNCSALLSLSAISASAYSTNKTRVS